MFTLYKIVWWNEMCIFSKFSIFKSCAAMLVQMSFLIMQRQFHRNVIFYSRSDFLGEKHETYVGNDLIPFAKRLVFDNYSIHNQMEKRRHSQWRRYINQAWPGCYWWKWPEQYKIQRTCSEILQHVSGRKMWERSRSLCCFPHVHAICWRQK